jgi:hypothetical protein
MRSAILLSFGAAVLVATSHLASYQVPREADKPTSQPGGPGDYLTRDGKLKEAVTFRKDTVGELAARVGKGDAWVIEPTGDWTSQTGARGKVSAAQLAALAQHLATQGFHFLPQAQGYKLRAGNESHQRVVIGFGKKSATFNLQWGESPLDYLPKPGDPQAAAWSRFVALELVLTQLLPSGPPPTAKPPIGHESPKLILDGSAYGRLYPAFADIDGDGKIDMVVGNWLGRLLVFRNTGTNAKPAYAKPTWLDETVPSANISGVQG